MDEKIGYVEEQLLLLRQDWAGKILVLGAILFLLLGILDYFYAPVLFLRFLIYRASIASALLVLYAFNQRRRSSSYQHAIIFIGTALSAITIEAMIMTLGGHKSPYYAGMTLLIICVLGYSPFDILPAILGMLLIYAIYLVPILFFDTITDLPTFILNNFFLISTLAIALSLRGHNQKATVREIELRYDLAEEKKKIEKQAEILEEKVRMRTRELQLSNQRFRELFDNANDGILVMDRNGIILSANNSLCAMYGYEKHELEGADMHIFEDDENSDVFRERMDSLIAGEALIFETEHHTKDGRKLLVEVSAKAIEIDNKLVIQSFHRDITDKKRLQEQLLQSQKMESLGILAGGLAHDFNNILTQIIGYAELISDEAEVSPSVHSKALIIEKAGLKAHVIVTKLLGFARTGAAEMKPVNLSDAVRDSIELLERMLIKRNIEVSYQEAPGLPAIKGDINQIEQIMINLLVNAADAMPDGGIITVSASSEEITRSISNPLLLEPGKYVILKVQDTGTGIPREIRDKIFDPFFTTKGSEKGTGLGLAMSYGIVKAHGGAIDVQSEVGKGTAFSIYFQVFDISHG
jgi:PAS domain S-box-containing protein